MERTGIHTIDTRRVLLAGVRYQLWETSYTFLAIEVINGLKG